jgi:hypothetical protein
MGSYNKPFLKSTPHGQRYHQAGIRSALVAKHFEWKIGLHVADESSAKVLYVK